jgi:hypothetical protein
MRRVLGGIAVALGAALLLLGFLAKPVIYAKSASVPLDYTTTQVSQGANMSVLRIHVGADGNPLFDKLNGATVRSTRNVLGIPGKVPADKQATSAFWQTGVKSEALGVGDLTYTNETVSFDRVSGESNNCCGDQASAGALDDSTKMVDIKHQGNFYKFPFDVQKEQTYQWWDGDLGKAAPASFVRTEALYGTDTYVFEQRIDQTQVGTLTAPAALFDSTGADVDAKIMYGTVTTLWVEPNTGVVIKGQQVINKQIVSSLGTVDATKGTIAYNEQTVRGNVDDWGSKGRQLALVKNTLGPVGIGAGLVLIVGGLALLLLRGRTAPAPAGAAAGTTGAAYPNEPVVEQGLEGLDEAAGQSLEAGPEAAAVDPATQVIEPPDGGVGLGER